MNDDQTDVVDEIVRTVGACAPAIRAGLPGRRVAEGKTNPSGETRMAADAYADDMLEERLGGIDGVGEYASEELTKTVDTGEGLSVAVDPLDGSSNLKPNNTMGTIVGVYDAPLPAPGEELVAAAYVLYGPITTMTVARGGTVIEYVVGEDRGGSGSDRAEGESGLDEAPPEGELSAVREDIGLPDDPSVYGFGGRVPDWTDEFTAYARDVEQDESIKLRYGGAMIGDVNQVLTYGGVFAYPALRSAPRGKLRLQFEGNPIGYIVESAGGRSSDGDRSLLDVEPDGLHQRVPVYVGNAGLIDRLESALD